MFSALFAIFKGGASRRLVSIASLVLLLGLGLPSITLADPPQPTGVDKCAKCHEEETEAWQNSVHAKSVTVADDLPGATCEACHGQDTGDHPDNDSMSLRVDSSMCGDCHTSTFNQWEDSRHAQAGVQCIGCHMSHSQVLRLTDEALCAACHHDQTRDDFHAAHAIAETACTDCHLSTATHDTLDGTKAVAGPSPAPNHDFADISADKCVGCHRSDIRTQSSSDLAVEWVTRAELIARADREPNLATELERVQQSNRTLQIMAPVSLGLGLGIGAMLGIIFILVISRLSQRRQK